MTRRQLIQTGIAGAVVLAVADVGYQLFDDGHSVVADDGYVYRVLSAQGRVIVAAIAPAMLAGALPSIDVAAAIRDVVRGFDTAVSGLTPSVQGEVQQLLSLLGFPITRWLVAGIGVQWHAATLEQVSAFLTRWRFSNVSMLRSAYDALHQLVNAAWYGGGQSWPSIGYPGPPKVG